MWGAIADRDPKPQLVSRRAYCNASATAKHPRFRRQLPAASSLQESVFEMEIGILVSANTVTLFTIPLLTLFRAQKLDFKIVESPIISVGRL